MQEQEHTVDNTKNKTKTKGAVPGRDEMITRLIQNEAKIQALMMGAKVERLPYIVQLADLTGVTVDQDMAASPEAVKKAVGDVLDQLPELKENGGVRSMGVNPGTVVKSKAEVYQERIQDARKNGSASAVIALKLQAAGEGIIIG